MSTSTRERLIDAAFELFSRHGFHAIGLDRILADVGVTKQTFYNHFESKDELILAVIHKRDQWERQLLRDMLQRFGGGSPGGQLHAIFDALHAWFNEPEFRGCLFINAATEFPSPHEPAHQAAAEHKRAAEAFLRDLATRAGAAEPHLLAEQLALLIDGAIVLRHVTGNDHAALIARRIAQPLLQKHLPCQRFETRNEKPDGVPETRNVLETRN